MILELRVGLLASGISLTLLTGCDRRRDAPSAPLTDASTSAAASGVATSTASLPPARTVRPTTLPGRSARQLTLRCSTRPSATQLELSYTVSNEAAEDAYVLDLSANTRADRSGFDVELRPIYLSWLGGSSAHLGQGIAPLPPDRDLYGSVIPLAARLAPGASLARTVRLPIPLAEVGPYDRPASSGPDSPSVDRLIVTLSALRPSAAGFRREEIAGQAGVFRVASQSTVVDVERARCEVALPRTTLHVFRWDEAHGPTFERAE